MNEPDRAASAKSRPGKGGGPLPIWKKVIYGLLPAVLVVALLEVPCRIYMKTRPPNWQYYEDRVRNPAYLSKPWFSKEFLMRSLHHNVGTFAPRGWDILLPFEYASTDLNVIRGERVTTGYHWKAGDPAPDKLFVIGGSTTYCAEVPDSLTWPSLLQGRVGQRYRVCNYGESAVISRQEVERLKYELSTGNAPRLCVFYNGVNDVAQDVYNGARGLTMEETAREHRRRWQTRLLPPLALVRVIQERIPPRRAPHLQDPAVVRRLAGETAGEYFTNMLAAKKLCDACGIKMVVILQPNLFTIPRALSPHEQDMVKLTERRFPGMEDAVCATYPLLAEKIAALQAQGVKAYDLQGALGAASQPIFLDWCHVESVGNGIIAQAVYERLKESL